MSDAILTRMRIILLAVTLCAASVLIGRADTQQGDDANRQPNLLLAKAEKGDAQSQFELGAALSLGKFGVAQDYEEAVRWLRKAAEQNFAPAQNHMGVCYHDGLGLTINYEEAVKWFRKAAEQGDADAQCNLGTRYLRGEGVATNLVEAVSWYHKAAEQNLAEAQYNLGVCYRDGQGVEKDETEASKWYLLALRSNAATGNAEAQNALGEAFYLGKLGAVKNAVEAMRWFRMAAEQNLAAAQSNLGICYERGDGVAKYEVEAYKWDLLAAAQGETKAKHNASLLELLLSPEDIADGKRRAQDWLEHRKTTSLSPR